MNEEPYILDYIECCKLAEKAHAKQQRFNGEPYIHHCYRVANNVGNCYLRKSIAMLHDVIEDTTITSSDLVDANIALEIVHCVEVLTKRRGENYHEYILRLSKNEDCVDVKIADLCDNMNINQLPRVTMQDIARMSRYTWAMNHLTVVKKSFSEE
jgi:guanosine-3',5'-bis(diphosphate) 3'-pyrophosphohydrolase